MVEMMLLCIFGEEYMPLGHKAAKPSNSMCWNGLECCSSMVVGTDGQFWKISCDYTHEGIKSNTQHRSHRIAGLVGLGPLVISALGDSHQ